MSIPGLGGPLQRTIPLERAAYALAVLFVIAVALEAGKPSFTNASKPQHGIGDSQIALQMSRTMEDVDAVLGDFPSPDRLVAKFKQYVNFGVIAIYTGLGSVLGLSIFRKIRESAEGSQNRAASGLLIALMLAVWLTALWDVLENLATLKVAIESLAQIKTDDIDGMRNFSLRKWTSASVTMLMLASLWIFSTGWRRGSNGTFVGSSKQARRSALWRKLVPATGGLEFLAGVLALWGCSSQERLHLFFWAGWLMAAGLVLNAATLKFLTYESPSQN